MSSNGDSQIPRFLLEQTLDMAGDEASRNSTSLNEGINGNEMPSVFEGACLAHAGEPSRARFEKELEEDNELIGG